MKYDVVIVGTRVAGAATALLLARQGLRVLAVDRARFPSDTLSTHQIQLPGVALLRRWGLLDSIASPPARTVRFDAGRAVLNGSYPSFDGVDAVYSPRRTRLDAMLLDAARDAGAEVREGFIVSSLLFGPSGEVTGIRGAAKGSNREEDVPAMMVIGADGKHSTVARAVGAREYHVQESVSAACYGYFADLPVSGGEIYSRPDRLAGLWPTDDGLTLVFLFVPRTTFDTWRGDLDAGLRTGLSGLADIGSRLDAATRAERLRGTTDLPNAFRVPHGPGWALVGDAGLVMDPITGQGIGNALQDAQQLSGAIVAGLGGTIPLGKALAAVHKRRDADRKPMYAMTSRLASFRPDPSGDILFPALARDSQQISQFLGVLTGAVPVSRFFNPANLRRLLGLRGLARLALARTLSRRSSIVVEHGDPAGIPAQA
jgi:2-polyprenyl-6-methoxyphenol hydroxylase-like FAD-dependent oxidoreductase